MHSGRRAHQAPGGTSSWSPYAGYEVKPSSYPTPSVQPPTAGVPTARSGGGGGALWDTPSQGGYGGGGGPPWAQGQNSSAPPPSQVPTSARRQAPGGTTSWSPYGHMGQGDYTSPYDRSDKITGGRNNAALPVKATGADPFNMPHHSQQTGVSPRNNVFAAAGARIGASPRDSSNGGTMPFRVSPITSPRAPGKAGEMKRKNPSVVVSQPPGGRSSGYNPFSWDSGSGGGATGGIRGGDGGTGRSARGGAAPHSQYGNGPGGRPPRAPAHGGGAVGSSGQGWGGGGNALYGASSGGPVGGMPPRAPQYGGASQPHGYSSSTPSYGTSADAGFSRRSPRLQAAAALSGYGSSYRGAPNAAPAAYGSPSTAGAAASYGGGYGGSSYQQQAAPQGGQYGGSLGGGSPYRAPAHSGYGGGGGYGNSGGGGGGGGAPTRTSVVVAQPPGGRSQFTFG